MVETLAHSCLENYEEKRATAKDPYHFVESGLPDVYLAGIRYRVCRICGKQSADIPVVKDLMIKLARGIVEKESHITGPEIRFLRKRLGKKSADFARIIGVSAEQVSRWENEHNPPEASADKLIRVFYCLLSGDRELRTKMLDKQIGLWLASLPGEESHADSYFRMHAKQWHEFSVPTSA